MADVNKGQVFKAPSSTPPNKADKTTEAARLFIEAELSARHAKTAKLKELRLAKEAEEAQLASAAAEAANNTAPRKRAAKKADA
jgi:hypothetical protein